LSRQASLSSEAASDEIDSVPVPLAAGPWRDRLSAHRKRFNPDVLGPYDIVVVLTGSNDLKSAFFPFLLTGEDAEFRRQARERGGSYNKELRRLVETLYDKMKVQIQHLREQVEAATESVRERVEQATETVRERVEETMERIRIPGGGSKSSLEQLMFPSRNAPMKQEVEAERCVDKDQHRHLDSSSTASTDDSVLGDSDDDDGNEGIAGAAADNCEDEGDDEASVQQGHSRTFPLVVLPGMPSRALPIFGTVPLRWLACPIVDIMDRHKHDLATNHPGQVLFVPAPALDDVREYESRNGPCWREKSDENVVLNLHDPVRDPSVDAKLERSMQEYYGSRRSWTWRTQSALFAEDQIHPNDMGYDFWGRYIGRAIYREWQS
jgi:lysophospholipase L1-like esterase